MKICGLDKCDNYKAAAAYAGSAADVTSVVRKALLSFDILHRVLVLVPVPYILAKAAPCGVEPSTCQAGNSLEEGIRGLL